MTPVMIVINLIVVPLLLVIFVLWCTIGAGIIRKIALSFRRFWRPNVDSGKMNFRSFFQDLGASVRSLSMTRAVSVFFYRPIEGGLTWIAMVIMGMILMGVWSAVVIALFGHYP
jgi:hypothetical protein